jgi:hypothetical protein
MDWASIIGIGLQFLGQKQASDASVGAASDYNAALIEAAKPKSVYDPTASAIWDEATQSYVLAPSAPMMGLFGANLQDAYRQRALIEDYMKDPESAAQARFAKTDAALAPFRAKEGEGLLSRLLQSGTAGSSLGAEQVAAREAQNRLYDATRLEAERAGVQSDITNYINRSNMAAQNAATYGSIGQNLANIGMGLGSDAYTAAAQGGQGLMNAQAASGFGYGQIPYAIGQNLMGYKKDPDVNLALQSKYLGRPSGYMGSVF